MDGNREFKDRFEYLDKKNRLLDARAPGIEKRPEEF